MGAKDGWKHINSGFSLGERIVGTPGLGGKNTPFFGGFLNIPNKVSPFGPSPLGAAQLGVLKPFLKPPP